MNIMFTFTYASIFTGVVTDSRASADGATRNMSVVVTRLDAVGLAAREAEQAAAVSNNVIPTHCWYHLHVYCDYHSFNQGSLARPL
jgi:hypothetical protein